jgi:hypothetical protein
MKFDCDKCGKIDEALFDGYGFGERILEGVMFKAKKRDNGTCVVDSVDKWEKDPYLSGLNKKHWMKLAKDYAEDNDIFECPTCKNDVVPDDMLV